MALSNFAFDSARFQEFLCFCFVQTLPNVNKNSKRGEWNGNLKPSLCFWISLLVKSFWFGKDGLQRRCQRKQRSWLHSDWFIIIWKWNHQPWQSLYIMSTARMVMSLITNATKHGRNVSLPGAHIVLYLMQFLQSSSYIHEAPWNEHAHTLKTQFSTILHEAWNCTTFVFENSNNYLSASCWILFRNYKWIHFWPSIDIAKNN